MTYQREKACNHIQVLALQHSATLGQRWGGLGECREGPTGLGGIVSGANKTLACDCSQEGLMIPLLPPNLPFNCSSNLLLHS